MDHPDPKALVTAFYAAFNAGERKAYCDFLHPDFRAEISGQTEVSGGFLGPEAFAEMVFGRVRQVFPGGLTVSVLQLIAEGEQLASRVLVTGRTRGGRAYRNPACHVFRLRGGRILEMIEYFDTALSRAAFEEAAPATAGRA